VLESTPLPGLRPEEVAPPGQQFFLRGVGVLADRSGRWGRLPHVLRSMTPYRQFFVDRDALSAYSACPGIRRRSLKTFLSGEDIKMKGGNIFQKGVHDVRLSQVNRLDILMAFLA